MMCKLLIMQLLAHLVSDFYLQTEKSCSGKANNAFKSKHLYIHVLVTFVFAWIFSLNVEYWWAALIISVLHLIIDGLKSVFQKCSWVFFYDQILHLAVIVATVVSFYHLGEISFPIWLPETKVLLWIVAFMFCLRPVNFIIQNIFKDAKISIPDSGKENSLPNAGRIIGNVERMLTLVFVLLGQYEAIGFLLAAKSLLRFRETDLVKSEYVLVGTLLSFGMAILVGVGVKIMIISYMTN